MSPVDEALSVRTGALAREIEPQRDLWPAIEAELADQHPARPARSRWLAITSMAATVLLAASLGYWAGTEEGVSNSPATVSEASAPPSAPQRGLTVGLSAEPARHAARLELARTIHEQLEALTPETAQVVLENLTDINQALDEIDAALEQAPASSLDRRLLMSMYADQLNLLTTMNRLILPRSQEIAI